MKIINDERELDRGANTKYNFFDSRHDQGEEDPWRLVTDFSLFEMSAANMRIAKKRRIARMQLSHSQTQEKQEEHNGDHMHTARVPEEELYQLIAGAELQELVTEQHGEMVDFDSIFPDQTRDSEQDPQYWLCGRLVVPLTPYLDEFKDGTVNAKRGTISHNRILIPLKQIVYDYSEEIYRFVELDGKTRDYSRQGIWISSTRAWYHLLKPSSEYRHHYEPFRRRVFSLWIPFRQIIVENRDGEAWVRSGLDWPTLSVKLREKRITPELLREGFGFLVQRLDEMIQDDLANPRDLNRAANIEKIYDILETHVMNGPVARGIGKARGGSSTEAVRKARIAREIAARDRKERMLRELEEEDKDEMPISVRRKFVDRIETVFTAEERRRRDTRSMAESIENTIYDSVRKSSQYSVVYRRLYYNLGKMAELRRRLLEGEIPVTHLVLMNPQELLMANQIQQETT